MKVFAHCLLLALCTRFVHCISLGIDTKLAVPVDSNEKDDDICIKEKFTKNFVQKKKCLTDEDYNKLQKCKSAAETTCNKLPGTISATYVEDTEGKYLILIDVYEFVKQACWGYALQSTDDLSSETFYFNFDNKSTHYNNFIYIRLGFKYNFTITPLPTGKPSTLITQAPNMCELEIIDAIYYRISEKKIFKNCEQPDYKSRRVIATKICQKHPTNPIKRYKMVHSQLKEQDCKFVLLPKNSLEETQG